MFVSRSSLEKPSPLERWVRTTSPSRYSTAAPDTSSSRPTSWAMVVLPAPERPVNQSTSPLATDLAPWPPVAVDAALELVRAGPAAGALVLTLRDGAGARNAADRRIPGVVERVVRDLVDVDVGLHAL